ncbi:MAG: DUF2339 domain-containing protein [Syntrophobacteraceae bacterium]
MSNRWKFKPLIAGLLGALVGASWGLDGFVTGAAMGFLLGDYLGMRTRVRDLEYILARLEAQSVAPPERGPIPASDERGDAKETPREVAQTEAPGAGAARVEPAVEDAPGAVLPTPPPMQPEPGATLPPVTASPPPFPASTTTWTRIKGVVARYFTTGNVPVRIGVLVLFFGVALLLQYAAERSWLPMEARLTGAALGGLSLLILGWRLRLSRRGYALVLQGGAVGVLHITTFAALRLYGFLPPGLAFTLLIALTVLSCILAVLQDSKALAVLGVLGGFLAPILTSTGEGSHVALFSYYALLNAGILGIAWFKAWRMLNLVGHISTFGIASAWGASYYRPEYFATTEPFLILFFLFYVGAATLFALRTPPNLKGYVDGAIVFGTPLIAFGLQALLVKDFEFGMAFSAFAASFLYISLAWIFHIKGPPSLRMLTEAFLAIGVVFATVGIPLAVDERWTASAWALEGAAMVWIGVRQKRATARFFGMLIQACAGFVLFTKGAPDQASNAPICNGPFLGAMLVSFSGVFTSFYLFRSRNDVKPWEEAVGQALGIWGALWWTGAGLREIDIYLPRRWVYGSDLAFLAGSCAAADHLRSRLRWPLPGRCALALLPAMVFALGAYNGSNRLHPFGQGGFVAWPLTFAALYHILHRREESPDEWEILKFFHAGALWTLCAVAAWELQWQVNGLVRGAGVWGLIAWGAIPALAVFVISTAGERLWRSIRDHYTSYITLAAGPVAAFAWLWSLTVNLTNAGDPWPLPFIPILNPLDLAVCFVGASIGFWLLRLKSAAPKAYALIAPRPAVTVTGASAFVWLNAILARTVHQWGGVAFSLPSLFDSIIFQASISLLWSGLSLVAMTAAAHRKLRMPWLMGATLMGVVVVKLFIIDLSKSGAIGRVISFIGVGVLLLIIGYLSPLPPKGEKEAPRQ